MPKKVRLLAFVFLSCAVVGVGYGLDFFAGIRYSKSEYDFSFAELMAAEEIGYNEYNGLTPYEYIKFVELDNQAMDGYREVMAQEGIDICSGCDEDGNPPPQDGPEIVMEPDIVESLVQSAV